MSKNEIVNVLTIKTEQSQQTIKGLKKEISDLKKILDNATIGSEQFEQASKELAQAQNTLKTAMSGQKQEVTALAGSYDALVAEMAKLKKEWRATADEAKRNEIGIEIDNINTQLKELDSTIGNNQRLVGSYAEEFKKALAEQDDATLQTRTKLESLQKVASGLASGYAAVQGAMTLLNIENENLQKAMVKVQSAMAIAQGVGGMKDLVEGLSRAKVAFGGAINGCKLFIGSLSGVQKAIIGTGIGALVVALGALIANWDKIVGMFKNDQTEIKNLEQSIKDLKEELQAEDEDFDFFIKLQQAAGKSREEILKLIESQKSQKFDRADEVYSAAVDSLVNYKKPFWGGKEELDKLNAAVKDAETIRNAAYKEWEKASQNLTIYQTEQETKRRQDAINSAKKEVDEKSKKQIDAIKEITETQIEEEDKKYVELEKKYQEYLKLFEGDAEKQLMVFEWYTDEYTKLVMEQLDVEIKANEKIAKSAEETRKKLAEEDKKRYENAVAASKERLSLELGGIDKQEEGKLYLNERKKPEGNGEINAIDNELSKLEGLKAITEEMKNLRIAAIEEEQSLFAESSARWFELEQQKIAIREQTERTLSKISEQYAAQEKARQRTVAKSITNTFTSALNSASQIIGAIQEGIDTTNKEGFEKNKKMQIANATIQMLVGITSAVAGAFTTKSGPWDIALAAIQAATIAATGGIQIANIKKQTYDGSGSGASVTPSVSMGSADIPVSYTRNLMGDAETEELNKSQRVILVESDMEESLRKVEIRESNTDF